MESPTHHLHFTDRLLARTILPLIPKFVRPNHITALRFLLAPLVVWQVSRVANLSSLALFLATAFTDALDGALARARNQVTNWGKLYDPLADKLLIGGVVFVLVLRQVDAFAALVIIILEALIIISAFIKHRRHPEDDIQANWWGKIKMLLQVLGVSVLIIAINFDLPALLLVSRGTFYLAIAFAIISLFTYSI